MKRYVILFFIIRISVSCNPGSNHDSIRKSNELINETSPYLLQHAYNPVHWYPWSKKAFDKAAQEQKLMIISIGFSSCHWCHVMEKESFSDSSVAELMNTHFVSIKVDKEERPDVDMTYMKAATLTLGGGGWPLNIIALPDGRPVYVSTYLSKEKWKSVLRGMIDSFLKEPAKLNQYADYLAKGMIEEYAVFNTNFADTTFMLKDYEQACLDMIDKMDWHVGGLAGASNKFPMPAVINLLFEYTSHHPNKKVSSALQTWLKNMARGGIFDQLGGGFSRYATDPNWTVPHFEKMLYDNAQLLAVYSNAYRVYGDEEFRSVAEMISEFLERELLDSSGGYYSSIDSESGVGEGKFYVWEITDFNNAVDVDSVVMDYFGITPSGNFEGANVLTRRVELNALSKKYHQPIGEIKRKIEKASESY